MNRIDWGIIKLIILMGLFIYWMLQIKEKQMKVIKTILEVSIYMLLVATMFVISSGCMEQFWPTAQVSESIITYAQKDPNAFKLPISTLGNIQKIRQVVAGVHLKKQIDLRAEMEKDEGLYALVLSEINVIIQKAQEQYQSAVGTLASPGWLSLLILGGSGGLLGRKLTTLTHYSEKEYQEGIKTAVDKIISQRQYIGQHNEL